MRGFRGINPAYLPFLLGIFPRCYLHYLVHVLTLSYVLPFISTAFINSPRISEPSPQNAEYEPSTRGTETIPVPRSSAHSRPRLQCTRQRELLHQRLGIHVLLEESRSVGPLSIPSQSQLTLNHESRSRERDEVCHVWQ